MNFRQLNNTLTVRINFANTYQNQAHVNQLSEFCHHMYHLQSIHVHTPHKLQINPFVTIANYCQYSGYLRARPIRILSQLTCNYVSGL